MAHQPSVAVSTLPVASPRVMAVRATVLAAIESCVKSLNNFLYVVWLQDVVAKLLSRGSVIKRFVVSQRKLGFVL